MLPVLQIGPVVLQTYPLVLLLAGWAGLAAGARLARDLGLDGDHIYNAGLYGLVAGLVVGRASHVIAFWDAYRSQPLDSIGLNPRAFLPLPAGLAALLIAAWYINRHQLSWRAVLDAAAPGALVAVILGGLGEMLTNPAMGAPAQVPWAITTRGLARHPVAIYEALAGALALLAAVKVLHARQRPGAAAWVVLLGYGLSRWLLEPFRSDSATILGGLRLAQVLGLAAVLAALWALRLPSQPAVEDPVPDLS